MTNKFDITKVNGKATVIDIGHSYPNFSSFAGAAGHPDAVNRTELINNGEDVNLLVRGRHPDDNGVLYVVATKDGRKAIFGCRGLSIKYEMPEITYDEAIKNAEKAIEVLRQAAYAEGYAQGKFDAEMERVATVAPKGPKELPQEKRDLIIEQAKQDVKRLLGESRIRMVPNLCGELESFYPNCTYPRDEVEFVINREKRTVVALIKYVAGKVWAKGIAKCAPDDCFNKHIGKVIALHRALGLEVPGKYLNVPQPKKVREGDKIKFIAPDHTFDGRIETVCGVDEDGAIWTKESSGWVGEGDCEIIDDSKGDDRE
ncbi:hypothetical protein [Bacillus chungangensis]|uniref:Uncharacterized protein n=1 Tax=Bacillus chungangensis TaxID=587633 RepID=A0ABT9WNU0_9BACI|nr:hypothetical protein [Bacillus chungangensis]MDQ0174450.1 hypothetical protein [Bacillus chungangensis]